MPPPTDEAARTRAANLWSLVVVETAGLDSRWASMWISEPGRLAQTVRLFRPGRTARPDVRSHLRIDPGSATASAQARARHRRIRRVLRKVVRRETRPRGAR